MGKYRKRPVVIDAEQWWPGKQIDGVTYKAPIEGEVPFGDAWIKTLEGTFTVTPGDWIITGVQGEQYPCKPAIFDATYEAVDDGRAAREG